MKTPASSSPRADSKSVLKAGGSYRDISSGGYQDSYQDISAGQATGGPFSGFGAEAASKSNDGWDDWNDSGWSQESPARRYNS